MSQTWIINHSSIIAGKNSTQRMFLYPLLAHRISIKQNVAGLFSWGINTYFNNFTYIAAVMGMRVACSAFCGTGKPRNKLKNVGHAIKA